MSWRKVSALSRAETRKVIEKILGSMSKILLSSNIGQPESVNSNEDLLRPNVFKEDQTYQRTSVASISVCTKDLASKSVRFP
ncbi:hypothetical protein BDZ97DRAFT_1827337 [Flammula alnicola]|nr:hypothetical protein BDZ97DRAFT_1827337 [Flammula alnicola]